MTRLVVVGDRGCGKTTFVGLLYAAQVTSGSDVADAFRFHVGVDSLDEISEAFNQLMSGGFPDSAVKEGLTRVTFQLEYGRAARGIMSRVRSRGVSATVPATFDLVILRNLEAEMSRFRQGGSLANVVLRDILEGDVFAILVDSTKFAAEDDDRPRSPMATYDDTLESLLAAVQQSRLHGARTRIHPIFIFSKFDSVSPAALSAAGVEGEPPAVKKSGPRTKFGQALLEYNLPRTIKRLRTRESRGAEFTEPSYFFSGVRTDAASPGRKAKVRVRSIGAGWEPDYSKDEYLALLRTLWKIAGEGRQ